MNTVFQPTANCQFTICLTQGVHPTTLSSPSPSISHLSTLLSVLFIHSQFAD